MTSSSYRSLATLIAWAVALTASSAAVADGLDVSRPIICASELVFECGPEGQCLTGPPETFDVPRIFQLDAAKKQATTIRLSGEQRTVDVAATHMTDDVLMLQGFRDTFGWSATIDRATGRLSLTSAGMGVGFTVFGTCGVL